jgi:hypothetical protein
MLLFEIDREAYLPAAIYVVYLQYDVDAVQQAVPSRFDKSAAYLSTQSTLTSIGEIFCGDSYALILYM